VKICPKCSELFPDDAGFCPYDGVGLDKSNDRYLGRTIASRYRLIKRLGSGGMSSVYLARHIIIDRLSALKILRKELGLNPSHRERFLREARAVNRINHRNIVEISDVGEADGVAYLVMEYVEGDSLHAHIQEGRFDWRRAARIAIQMSSALARAHQMGIIHRDLKPENVLIVKDDGGRDIVKLTDFGIAKIMDMPSLTFSEQLFGTPGYIAPEYVEGIVSDERADIYSLGVVLYEMITGTLPYEWEGQADLLLKPLTHPPIPPSARVGMLPPGLESLLLSMLARRAEDRPADAFAVHDALVEMLRRSGSISWSSLPGIAVTSLRSPSTAQAPSGLHEAVTGVDVPSERTGVRIAEAAQQYYAPSSSTSAGAHSVGMGSVGVMSSPVPSGSTPSAIPAIADSSSGQMSAVVSSHGTDPSHSHVLSHVPDNMPRLPHLATPEMATKWRTALAELEARIGDARRLAGSTDPALHERANRASELAAMASEMIPRVERSSRAVAELQSRVDRVEARGREFRSNLGHAIDVLLRDRSRERAHLEAVRARHDTVEAGGTPSTAYPASTENRDWEESALRAEEERMRVVVEDLGYQIEALQGQLDAKNDEIERELTEVSGALEGSVAALRRMSSELARTIRDGIALVG
jgi:serine/threonine-protein kinase